MEAIKTTSIEIVTTNTIQHVLEFNVNDLYAVVWVVNNSKQEWFLAYIKEQVSE